MSTSRSDAPPSNDSTDSNESSDSSVESASESSVESASPPLYSLGTSSGTSLSITSASVASLWSSLLSLPKTAPKILAWTSFLRTWLSLLQSYVVFFFYQTFFCIKKSPFIMVKLHTFRCRIENAQPTVKNRRSISARTLYTYDGIWSGEYHVPLVSPLTSLFTGWPDKMVCWLCSLQIYCFIIKNAYQILQSLYARLVDQVRKWGWRWR